MNKVAVLDCTLRDGGYVNDFDFSKNTIKTIINKLGKAHMDIIECGFLKNIEYDENKSLYSDVDQITPLITPKKKHTMYVAMIVTGTIQASKIIPRRKDTIDGIRITFHKKEMDEAFELGYALMDKGYEVFMQPVGTTSYSDVELLELFERINEMKPYAFYLVDTLGKLYAKQLLKLFYLADDNLDEDITIGYHSHNNLQLSFSNAQQLIQSCGKRNIIIDGSVLGMGRGAGNCFMEQMLSFLRNPNYKLTPTLKFVEKYVAEERAKGSQWGYDVPYMLTGALNRHPRAAIAFLKDNRTDYNELYMDLLNELS